MDAIIHTLLLWENEGIIVLLVLSGVIVFHYLFKLWGTHIDAPLYFLLIASAILGGAVIYLLRLFGLGLSTRVIWFIAFYTWCMLGMLFFAGSTHRAKLLAALAAQAGILYGLFALL